MVGVKVVLKKAFNLYSIIMPLNYYVFENIMENGAFLFSIIFSKLHFFIYFFQLCLKMENDDRSKNSLWSKGLKGCLNIREFKYLG